VVGAKTRKGYGKQPYIHESIQAVFRFFPVWFKILDLISGNPNVKSKTSFVWIKIN